MLIGPQALKSLNSIEKIQPRMMVATSNGNPSETILSCYSPTNVTDEPITKMISNHQDSLRKNDSVLRKIKNRKAAGLDEIPSEVWKTRQFDDILL